MEKVIRASDCVNLENYSASIHDGIIIPHNATNGEIIKELFPNCVVIDGSHNLSNKVGFKIIDESSDNHIWWFPESWWNKKYEIKVRKICSNEMYVEEDRR